MNKEAVAGLSSTEVYLLARMELRGRGRLVDVVPAGAPNQAGF